jgi:quinol monooxygenase YgiN
MCTQAWEIQSISPEAEKIRSNFGWSGPASPAAQPSVSHPVPLDRGKPRGRRDMSGEISWHVELHVKPRKMKAFRNLTRQMVESTRSERGALIYERFIGDDNQSVHVFERYADSSAAVAHLTTFARLHAKRFAALVERKRFTVFGTPTPELRQILDPLGAKYFALLSDLSRASNAPTRRSSRGS